MRSSLAIALVGALGAGGCGDNMDAPADAAVVDASDAPGVVRPPGVIDGRCLGQPGRPRVLEFARENQWRHASNYYAHLAIFEMCTTRGFDITTTLDPNAFTPELLAQIDTVVFSVTSGPVLDPVAREVLEEWLRNGGGFVGIHSASSTEQGWPYYVSTIGVDFAGHAPGVQLATVTVESTTHPITAGLQPFQHTDEWYYFAQRPENVPGMEMLLALDEATLPADFPAQYKQGYHPIAWAHERLGARVFYTALGHTIESYSEPAILDLLGRAIEWTSRKR